MIVVLCWWLDYCILHLPSCDALLIGRFSFLFVHEKHDVACVCGVVIVCVQLTTAVETDVMDRLREKSLQNFRRIKPMTIFSGDFEGVWSPQLLQPKAFRLFEVIDLWTWRKESCSTFICSCRLACGEGGYFCGDLICSAH